MVPLPGLVVLISVGKLAEQAKEIKPVSNIPPCPLHQDLLPDMLEFSADFFGQEIQCGHVNEFPLQLGHDVCAGIEILRHRIKDKLKQKASWG